MRYQTQDETTVLFHPARIKHNTEHLFHPVPSAYQTLPNERGASPRRKSAASYWTPGIIPYVGPTFHHHRHRNTETQPSWLNCHAVTLLVIHRRSGGAELIGANYFNRFVFNIMYLERCRYCRIQGRSVGPSLWGQIKK